jgi:hypothetical protein
MYPLLQNMGQNCTPIEVAPGVVGFRLAFRLANGTLENQALYTGYNPNNPVVAVDVGLAVIGKQSLELLSASQIQTIETEFANATPPNGAAFTGIKMLWDQTVLSPSSSPSFYATYPALGNGLKTFERCVACTPF